MLESGGGPAGDLHPKAIPHHKDVSLLCAFFRPGHGPDGVSSCQLADHSGHVLAMKSDPNTITNNLVPVNYLTDLPLP